MFTVKYDGASISGDLYLVWNICSPSEWNKFLLFIKCVATISNKNAEPVQKSVYFLYKVSIFAKSMTED